MVRNALQDRGYTEIWHDSQRNVGGVDHSVVTVLYHELMTLGIFCFVKTKSLVVLDSICQFEGKRVHDSAREETASDQRYGRCIFQAYSKFMLLFSLQNLTHETQ